jgi:hypothetical protein
MVKGFSFMSPKASTSCVMALNGATSAIGFTLKIVNARTDAPIEGERGLEIRGWQHSSVVVV